MGLIPIAPGLGFTIVTFTCLRNYYTKRMVIRKEKLEVIMDQFNGQIFNPLGLEVKSALTGAYLMIVNNQHSEAQANLPKIGIRISNIQGYPGVPNHNNFQGEQTNLHGAHQPYPLFSPINKDLNI